MLHFFVNKTLIFRDSFVKFYSHLTLMDSNMIADKAIPTTSINFVTGNNKKVEEVRAILGSSSNTFQVGFKKS